MTPGQDLFERDFLAGSSSRSRSMDSTVAARRARSSSAVSFATGSLPRAMTTSSPASTLATSSDSRVLASPMLTVMDIGFLALRFAARRVSIDVPRSSKR